MTLETITCCEIINLNKQDLIFQTKYIIEMLFKNPLFN